MLFVSAQGGEIVGDFKSYCSEVGFTPCIDIPTQSQSSEVWRIVSTSSTYERAANIGNLTHYLPAVPEGSGYDIDVLYKLEREKQVSRPINLMGSMCMMLAGRGWPLIASYFHVPTWGGSCIRYLT